MDFNPFDPAFRQDPYPKYAELRREAPVYRHPAMGFTAVSRYDGVVHVLMNPNLFSSKAIDLNIDGNPTRTVINTDPPLHTSMRNLVNRAFTPRMVAELEPRIREITASLLDAVVESGETDLVRDLAIPLPVAIIAGLLGIDDDRHDDFKRWSTVFIGTAPGEDGERARQDQIFEEARAYFREVIDARRRQPGSDLISALVAVSGDDEEHLLGPSDLLAFIALLLVAGNETTTNLIGNAVLALLDHPEQLEMLRRDMSLLPNAVEEALRYESPVQNLFRTATEDTEIGGVPVPKDSGVIPIYASANRDDAKFPDGDRFDITRNTQGHVAFGHGVHFCLGAPLARLEAKVALEQVILRMPGLRREPGRPEWFMHAPFLRGLVTLRLSFAPTAAGAATVPAGG
ncbi:MAG: cytochrome P450 [Dehalococcoidia bacterium]